MKFVFFAFGLLGLFCALPSAAATIAPPNLTISVEGKKPITVPVFDKWTDGGTVAIADLGGDGVAEIIVGAGPGSVPEIRILRQDGSLINKFNAFHDQLKSGVIVGVLDADFNGANDIVVATGPQFAKLVRVFNGYGTLTSDWYPIPSTFNTIQSSVTVGTVTASISAPHYTRDDSKNVREIIVDLSDQRLYAYENGKLANTFLVSTGTNQFPTRPGTYSVLSKTKIMDYRWSYGPGNPNNYFIKNVKWNTRFAKHLLIHQAYWHNDFGRQKSHGCVNATEMDAQFIYEWSEIGTPVYIQV